MRRWPGWLAAYLGVLLTLTVLDALWLGVLATGMYRDGLGPLMRAQPAWTPALLFYLAYPAGVVALALQPWPADWRAAAGRSALLGLFGYATYGLTNLATLVGWPAWLVPIDIAWGVLITGSAGTVGWWASRRFV